MKKLAAALMGTMMLGCVCFTCFVGCNNNANSGKTELIVDGGGIAANYNSSISMTPSEANPNPYNYLEVLADEWSANNENYYITINRNSMNGNRDSILGYLSAETGPDIIFQTGTTIAEDMEMGYFVDMTDYLDEPNPYVEGNEKWSDLYDPQELEASRAPNGSFYSVGIDRNVVGIMYNEDMLKTAGVSTPINTYGELLDAIDKLKDTFGSEKDENNKPNENYIEGFTAYTQVDNWYDIVIESALYGGEIDKWDVVRENGIIDSEELCRASQLNEYKIKDGNNIEPRFETYMNMIYELNRTYLAGSVGNTAVTNFMQGRVAMVSCLGKSMVQAVNQSDINVGAMGYPIVTQADVDEYGGVKGVTISDKGVRRGISGIGTGWWITNSAMKKGDDAVAACVDFLQFVTAPEQNVPMVNKLGYAIPLDTEAAVAVKGEDALPELFQELITTFNQDVEDGYYEFHVFNSWGVMGFDYWSRFVTQSRALYDGGDLNSVVDALNTQFLSSRDTLVRTNSNSGAWNVDGWASLGTETENEIA